MSLLTEFEELNDLNKNIISDSSGDICPESLYRVADVRVSSKSPLVINFLPVENKAPNSNSQSHLDYGLNDKLMIMLGEAQKSKNWDVFLSNVRQGMFLSEGTFRGENLSLFDVVFMTLPPQEIISELIGLNVMPTMYSFEYFTQFKHLGSSKLKELEFYYYPNIEHKVKYQDVEINLATYSFISKNMKALEYWQAKGLNVENEKLDIEKTIINNESTEVAGESKHRVISAFEDGISNDYSYFTLLKVKECKQTKLIRVIDTISNIELNTVLESLGKSDEDAIKYLDTINPLFTEVYLDNYNKAIEYESITANSVVNDAEYFFKTVTEGILDKNTRIYTSSSKNGLTILDYALFFSIDNEIISYLFENDFPLSLNKLSHMLTIKPKQEEIFDVLEANNFDFEQTENGKNLLHYAIKTGDLELIIFLKSKGIPLIENFGVDALEYTLRNVDVSAQIGILEVISSFYPTFKKRHEDIFNNFRVYEPDRYESLVRQGFLKNKVVFK